MSKETRTRSRVLLTESADRSHTHDTYYPGSCSNLPLYSSLPSSGSGIINQVTESMTDVVTSDFEKLRNNGLIVNNPMTKQTVTRSYPMFEFDGWVEFAKKFCTPARWEPYSYKEMYGTVYLPGTNPDFKNEAGFFVSAPDMSGDIGAAKSLAINEAWANIDSSELMALVSLMESGKTLMGITDTFRRLNKFLKNVKRLQLTELRKMVPTRRDRDLIRKRGKRAWNSIKEEFSFDALMDRYMELRYGWRPLVYDVRGAFNAYKAEYGKMRQTFRGFERISASTQGDPVKIWAPTWATWASHHIWGTPSTEVEVAVRAGVLTDVDLDNMDPWGISLLPESLLELVPYSFVLNWFFNISDTLAAWTPNVGFNPLASWVSVKTTTTQMCQVTHSELVKSNDSVNARYTGDMNHSTPTYIKKVVDYTRSPDPSRAILPRMKVRLNAAKLADLAIIAKNLVYGGRYPLATRSLRV